MCGIAGIFGQNWRRDELAAMINSQKHRGPDAEGIYISPQSLAGLGHNRLSIIDLSESGKQPMADRSGTRFLVFNGEVYNYLELKNELASEYDFKTKTDTEVLLAAYDKWGEACLERLLGMFSFVIWDEREKRAFAARDRFGVKPFYYHQRPDGTLLVASEIKALHAAGVPRTPNQKAWATYLTYGLYDHSRETFWEDIYSLPAGHKLSWRENQTTISCWYDLAEKVGDEIDARSEAEVRDEYFALMKDSVRLRFRADVPVGINLSGGLDSSSLLGLVHEIQGSDSAVKAFTFATGDERYDELPWVRQMLDKTQHPLEVCQLSPEEVPALAASVQRYQDEPFGGIPTLAYARLFEQARESGVIVLLDGNGMDEQWCGYDYYQNALDGFPSSVVQGTTESPVKPECLTAEFREVAEKKSFPAAFEDKVRNLQYRDTRFTKIPRAMRFNDRVSMRSSTELREPFLDHRLFELAFRQPTTRKIQNGTRKKMLREITCNLLPNSFSEVPKRPLQTPQREWLRESLRDWANDHIQSALASHGWLDKSAVEAAWQKFLRGESDNSFYIWQWISLSLMSQTNDSLHHKLSSSQRPA